MSRCMDEPRMAESPGISGELCHYRTGVEMLEQGAGNSCDLALPTLLILVTPRRVAAHPQDKCRLSLIICQRDKEVFRVEIFPAFKMDAAQKAHGLASIQNKIATFDPTRQVLRRD